jgi:hypothetical protein
MSLFNITTGDLQRKIMPTVGEQTFVIGTANADLLTADAEEIIRAAEDVVLSRLDFRYRQLCRRIDGEILTLSAVAGETEFRASMFPITTGTLKLWKNYPQERLWESRDDSLAMDAGDFTATLSTGVIVLTAPLAKGDALFASYDHTGAGTLSALRHIALCLAAVEVARRTHFFGEDGDPSEKFKAWEDTAYGDLNRLKCVDRLDNIKLVRQDTSPDNFYQRVAMIRTT